MATLSTEFRFGRCNDRLSSAEGVTLVTNSECTASSVTDSDARNVS